MVRNLSALIRAAIVMVVGSCFGSFVACFADDHAADTVQANPDLSTPKSAALAWIEACSSGREDTAHLVLMDDEKQRQFIAGALQFSSALKSLEAASIRQFGEAGQQVTGLPNGSATAIEKQITLQKHGDQAIVSIPNSMLPLELKRIDGQWRVDLSKAVEDPRAHLAAKASIAAAKVAVDVAAEITQGKYPSAAAAATAFRERRLAAVKN